MTHPARALLPCLIMLAAGHAWAQDADPPQDLPVPNLYAQASGMLQSPVLRSSLAGSYVSADQGFPGQVRTAAATLRQNSVVIPGQAPGRMVRLGDRGEDVQWLIEALILRGYLTEDHNPRRLPGPIEFQASYGGPQSSPAYTSVMDVQSEYTQAVQDAVIAFQAAHGLKEDGVAGNRVYSSLTVDHTALANALDAWASNVAFWADQARAQGHDRMIVVNIPSYTLHAIDLSNNEEVLQSRVIVGKPYTQTPVMMTRVVNLKANPDWSPPKSIKGARYQRPGPNNALGLMRFSTDNNMNIYLHDTNARGLFANDDRALSHGCVRVQQWQPLAAWVARQDETWVDEVALVGGKTRFLKVDAVPVVITYSLADVVEGTPRKFEDIYHRKDRAIGYAALQGMSEPAPRDWMQGR